LVVLAVVAYNKWQENRLRRKTESAFATVHEDVLLHGGASVNEDMDAAAAVDGVPPVGDTRVEHTLSDPVPEEVIPPAPAPIEDAAGVLPHAALNEAVDCIAMLECPTPVAGARIAARAEPLFDV